jgi:hypothetical protein
MASRRKRRGPKPTMMVLASRGGLARKAALTSEERSAIAKKAADERWAIVRGLPKETHTGILKLGDGIPCSVLDNKMRVFSVNGLLRAFGSGAKGRAVLDDGIPVPGFLSAANVRPFISDDLVRRLTEPVPYRSMTGGRTALGYEATIIRKICDTLLDARAAGVLREPQLARAQAAEGLLRGFADVGIISLIDQATGYTADQASDELNRLVSLYVADAMRPYMPLFREAFFQQIYRLYGWPYKPGVTQGPRYVGKFINKYIYEYLPPGALAKMNELNPIIGKRRKHKHHQLLTKDIGEPAVDRHTASITTLLSVSTDKRHFDEMVRLAFPRPGEQMAFTATAQPPVLHSADDDEHHVATPDVVVVDGVEIETADRAIRERIMAELRSGNTVGSGDLAMAVYGDRREGTLNKLRKAIGRLRAEELVESPSKGIWKLRQHSPA